MKKVININFQGRVVMIEEEAYENLKSYIESLRKHFANEEGCDEIVNDIENRISELFAEVIKKGNPCVSESDLEAIIHSIGRPEDLEDEETTTASSQQQSSASQSQQAFQQTNASGHKQFFRDENNKKLGGVCAGLANYFNIDPTVIRLIALVLLVCYGIGFIPYIILWIAVPSSATQVIGSTHKRLYRDISHKTIGGVCSGLANYFSVSLWIPKVIFLVGAFCSFPLAIAFDKAGGFFFPGLNFSIVGLYIILWAVVPAAVTASDKLSMKGKNVDLNSIKDTVQEDLGDGKKKINNTTMSNNNPHQELIPVRERSTLGSIIVILFKVFAYFVLGCILIGVICGLFGIGIGAFGLYPLKGYIIGGTWQNTLAILSIVLFVWLPVIGIIIWIIRALTKTKRNVYLRMTFIGLWLVGLMSVIALCISVYNDVREVNNPVEQAVILTNPKVQKLEINYLRKDKPFRFSRNWIFGHSSYSIQTTRTYYRRHTFFDDFVPSITDSALVNNTSLHFVPASDDSFSVDITKLSNGNSVADANLLADRINYSGIEQQDSVLNIPSYFALNQTDKFRNQFVVITVSVPLGKKIVVHQNDGYSNKIFLGFDDDFDEYGRDWNYDEEYVMTKDGLKSTHIDTDDDDNDNDADTLSEQKIQEQQQKLNEQRERLKQQNEEQKHKLEEQIQQLKKDSEKINAVSAKFESPVMLMGKAFLKMI